MSKYDEVELDRWIGKSITLRGIAGEAHAGPIVLVRNETEEFPIYIDGMESWEPLSKLDIQAGDEVEVTGTLKKVGGHPNLIAENGTASHGMGNATFHIQRATFMKAKPNDQSSST